MRGYESYYRTRSPFERRDLAYADILLDSDGNLRQPDNGPLLRRLNDGPFAMSCKGRGSAGDWPTPICEFAKGDPCVAAANFRLLFSLQVWGLQAPTCGIRFSVIRNR